MVDYEENIIKAPIVIDTVSENSQNKRQITKLIIDIFDLFQGSGVIKAGLGGEEKPAVIFNNQ